MLVIISLIGEQPAPNLLPIRHYKPGDVVFVRTTYTKTISENLAPLVKGVTHVHTLDVHPYRILEITQGLRDCIIQNGWVAASLVFNVTGGTKPMALAAYDLAQRGNCPVIYLQSEGNRCLLYRYKFTSAKGVALIEEVELSETISIDDYLRMYLRTYQKGKPKNGFEQVIYDTLQETSRISEVAASIRPVPALEIDLVIRCGNQVGIAEVKETGDKRGIDQLNAAGDQRYLGTYTKKILISGSELHPNNKELAQAYGITVVELPNVASGNISEEDKQYLVERITKVLGGCS